MLNLTNPLLTRAESKAISVFRLSDGRFRHGSTFLRVRPDKLPKDCSIEQVFQEADILEDGTVN